MIQSNSLLKKEIFTMGTKSVSDKVAWASITAAFLLSLAVIAGPNATTAIFQVGDGGETLIAGQAPIYKEGEVIVKLREGEVPDFLSLVYASVSYEKLLEGFNLGADGRGLGRLYLVKAPAGLDAAAFAALVGADKRVEYAEPNFRYQTAVESNDPEFSKLWGMNNTGQSGGVVDADIDAIEAWGIRTSSDVVVGIIDTGVDFTHEDLIQNKWVNAGEIPNNLIDDDGNGFVDDIYGWDFVSNDNSPTDDYGHGTHVAGTIGGAGNNSVGVAGVNWNIKMASLKFLDSSGSGYTANAVKAIMYANQMGFKITSNSWSGGGYSQTLYDAISLANDGGKLFVAAAGNDGSDIDKNNSYPAGYDLPNIISVAATDHNDALASFSNYGLNNVDIGAPGVNVYSTVPKPVSICTNNLLGVCLSTETQSCALCDASGYKYLNGTSMATPHVAGAAALLWSEYPTLSNLDLKRALVKYSDVVPSLSGKTLNGGRLNLYSSLNNAGNLPPNSKPIAKIAGPLSGEPRAEIVFDGSESYDPDNDRITYSWDFGDGKTAVTYGATTSHSYSKGDDYSVKLKVNDGFYASDIASYTLQIQGVEVFSQTNWSGGVFGGGAVPFYATTSFFSTAKNVRFQTEGQISLNSFLPSDSALPSDSDVYTKQGFFSTVNTTSTQVVSGVGFKPKAVIFYWTGEDESAGTYDDARYGLGFTAETKNGSYVDQAFVSSNAYLAYLSGVPTDYFGSHGEAILASINFRTTEGGGGIGRVTSLNDDGFTIQWTTRPKKKNLVHYLALGGPGIINTKSGHFISSSKLDGIASVSNVGFSPDLVMLVATGASDNTIGGSSNSSARMTIGFMNKEGEQGAMTGFFDNKTKAMNTCGEQRSDASVVLIGGSNTDHGCSKGNFLVSGFYSMDPNGFSIKNLYPGMATGREIFYLAIKGGSHKIGNFSKKTSTGEQEVSGMGLSPQSVFLLSRNKTATTSITIDNNMTIGSADSSGNSGSIAVSGPNGVRLEDPQRRTVTGKVFTNIAGTNGTISNEAALAGFTTDGVKLNWTTANSDASNILYWAVGSSNPIISGILESTTIDTEETDGFRFSQIRWDGRNFDIAKNQIIKYQIAASSSPDGPWNFKGPDGTANTYYGGSYGPETDISLDWTYFQNSRYFRYKVFLFSETTTSPTLDEIEVRWEP